VPDGVKLTVKGDIPLYAAGVLYRTGPLGFKVKTDVGTTWAANHWFDGLSCVHRFEIKFPDGEYGPAEVSYRSRRNVDELLEMVKTTGKLDAMSFANKRDPCRSFFQKVMSLFTPTPPDKDNIGVTLSVNMPGGDSIAKPQQPATNGHSSAYGIQTLHAKTDSPGLKQIDPETLEPIGIASQSMLHPELVGQFSASHAKSDPITGDLYNFNLHLYGPSTTYRVFCTSASTGETSILATFPGKGAYIHSLFLSESYVILCVWNSFITWGGLSIPFNQNVVESIQRFDPSQKATWYVVDRRNGKGVVATYESDAFFCFHTVNAWEEPSATDPTKTDIITELVMYKNLDIIHRFFYDNLMSLTNPTTAFAGEKRLPSLPQHTQFRLSSVGSVPPSTRLPAEMIMKADKMISIELPTINPAYVTRRHRYTYGNGDRLKSAFLDCIIKFDNITKTAVIWEAEGQTPGEAIFVADPEGKAEDDGVLLSVVLDGYAGKSYLLVLDARDLTEKGRAMMDGPMSFGFHGTHKGLVKYRGDA
jgi:torulene dioxygenase